MIRIEQATIEHARNMAPRLAHLDRQEIAIYTPGAEPEAALISGVANSADAKALIRGDRVIAMWGVMDARNVWGDRFGAPWLLAADKNEFDLAATRQLLTGTRRSVGEWHQSFVTLFGFSWAGATDHHRLLRKLGFELSEKTTEAPDTGAEIPPTVYFARREDYVRTGERYFN